MHRPTGVPDLEIAMGWHIFNKVGTEMVWHNGGTAGYRSFAGFVPAKKTGVVVLCNTSLDNDDLGRHILESQFPLRKYSPAKERKEITLDPQTLEKYVGEYELAPTVSMKITREASHLFAQITGQPPFELLAEKENEFFLKAVDAQITFS